MRGIFQDFFAPKTVIGLQIEGLDIHIVQVSNPTGRPTVERAICRRADSAGRIGVTLRTVLSEEKLNPEMIITCLPASKAVIREIDVPLHDIKKLEKIIKYQMEPHVPHAIEEMVVDFLPPQPGNPVWAVGMEKQTLSGHFETLSTAGIEAVKTTLDDTALYFLYVHIHNSDQSQPVAIVNLKETETAVLIVQGERLCFLRNMQHGTDIAASIAETLKLYRLKDGAEPVENILLTGPAGAAAPETAAEIETATGVPAALWKPLNTAKNGFGEFTDDLQARLSVPLGLAIGLLNASPRGLDLRKEEFSLDDFTAVKRPAAYAASALVLLVAMITFNVYHSLGASEKRYRALNAGLQKLLVETFPDVRVIKGRELAQMEQYITAEKSRFGWLSDITGSGAVLDTLLVITNTIAGFRDVKVDNLSMEGSRILFNGRAGSFKTVDSLKNRFEHLEFFKNVKLVGAKMDNNDRMVRFDFIIQSSSR